MIRNIGPDEQYNLSNKYPHLLQNQQSATKKDEIERNKEDGQKQWNTGNNFCGKEGQNRKYQQNNQHPFYTEVKHTPQPAQKAQGKSAKPSNQYSTTISDRFRIDSEFKNQIQRISAELASKNEEIRLAHKNNEKRKAQIIQLQKAINNYEGRLAIMDDALRKYEQGFLKISQECDQNSKYKSQVEELVKLFEGMRKQNQSLSGKYQEKSYQLNKLTEKYIRLKNKVKTVGIFQERSNEFPVKSVDDKLKRNSSLLKRVYEPTEDDVERQRTIKTLSLKIQSIQTKISQISKENEKLFAELEERDEIISKLTKELQQRKLNRINSKSLKKTLRPDPLKKSHIPRQICSPADSIVESQYQLSHRKNQPPKPNIQIVLRKLKYNILTEEVTYQNLIDLLLNVETKPEDLQKVPYGLNHEEAKLLMEWVGEGIAASKRNMKESGSSTQEDEKQLLGVNLSQRIGKFKSLLIKQQYTLKIQAYNTFLNRENELLAKIEEENLMNCLDLELFLGTWGLRQAEIDVILKEYYDKTGEVETVNLTILKEVIEKWVDL